jgi:Sulfotransferase family
MNVSCSGSVNDAAGPAEGGERLKVIYVMGAGRSGSTILGITLGNCSSFFCAGELHLWLGKEGRSPLRGEGRARFWSQVAQEVAVTPSLSRREVRALEQSSAILRPRGWRVRRWRNEYRRVAEELYRAVAQVANVRHVIDTSHFPRRARELQALDGIELYLLLVVRSPEDVVMSYSRDNRDFPRFNIVTTNAYLWLTYLLSVYVFLRHPRRRRLLVRYEAFVANPQAVLRNILDGVGSSAAIPDLTALKTGVAFQGNQILRSDVIALKRSPERPQRRSRITAMLNLPWTLIFSLLRPVAGGSAATEDPAVALRS